MYPFLSPLLTGKHQQMIACFPQTLTLLFGAFLTDEKTLKEHPVWPKILQEKLGNCNLDRRFYHLAMRHVDCPRAAIVALLLADPQLQQTLQQQTLPPTAKRPVPLTVFVFMRPIPGLNVLAGEQLRQFDALPIGSHPDCAAVAREWQAILAASPWRQSFSVQVFNPEAHHALITAAAEVYWHLLGAGVLGGWVVAVHISNTNIYYKIPLQQFY